MIEVLKKDIKDELITKSDAITIIFALLFGELLIELIIKTHMVHMIWTSDSGP